VHIDYILSREQNPKHIQEHLRSLGQVIRIWQDREKSVLTREAENLTKMNVKEKTCSRRNHSGVFCLMVSAFTGKFSKSLL
jgi:hypothetical protein